VSGLKAPAGGTASVVNGRFYDGGQFMPTTGQFCDASPARKLKAINAALAARYGEPDPDRYDPERTRGYERVVDIGGGMYQFQHRRHGEPWQGGCRSADLTDLVRILGVRV